MESTPQQKSMPDFYSYSVCTASSVDKHLLKPARGLHAHVQGKETSVFCEQICLEGHVKLSHEVTLAIGIQH